MPGGYASYGPNDRYIQDVVERSARTRAVLNDAIVALRARMNDESNAATVAEVSSIIVELEAALRAKRSSVLASILQQRLEATAREFHEAWRVRAAEGGRTSSTSSVTGEELMVPWDHLSDECQAINVELVRAVLVAAMSSTKR